MMKLGREEIVSALSLRAIRSSLFLQLLVAIGSSLLFCLVQFLLREVLAPFPYATCLPAVLLAAIMGGRVSAFVTVFLSNFLHFFLFVQHGNLSDPTATECSRLLIITGNGLLVAATISYFFEKSLATSESRHLETLIRMGDAYIIYDSKFRFKYMNPKALEFLNTTEENLLGKNLYEVYPFLKGTEWDQKAINALATGKVEKLEMPSDTGNIWYEVQIYPEKGKGIKVFWRDITARKTAEKANTELKKTNERLTQFAHITSHDMKEPLRMISNYAQLLRRTHSDALSKDGLMYLNYVNEGAMRMHNLITDILKYSNLESELSNTEQVSVNNCVQQALLNLEVQIKETNALIEIQNSTNELSVPRHFIQVLQNLLSNAIKFSDRNRTPKIQVSITEDKDSWGIQVKDNGIGIDSEYFEKIFIVFQKLHSKSEYPGSGIGLYACKKIVEHFGGQIWVESKVNEGSTFYIKMPKN